MYNVFEIIPLLFYLFKGYCLQYFFGKFLEGRSKSKWTTGLAAAVLYAAFLSVIGLIEPSDSMNSRPAIWKLALSLCMLCVIALCIYKGFRLITVFLLTAFQAVADISQYTIAVLFGAISSSLSNLLENRFENVSVETYQTSMVLMNGIIIGELVLGYAAMGLLLYFSLKRIVKDFREKDHGINITELLFLLVPSAVGLMICMLLRIIMVNVENGVPKLLYEKYPALTAVIPAILLLSLFSILCGVKLFQDMINLNREKTGKIILEKQIAAMREQMDETERVYSDIRRIKHDMKNTVSVITHLSELSGDENKELKEYLAGLNCELEKSEIIFKTGNAVADTLLNMKYHEWQHIEGLEINADKLIFPDGLKISSYDIGVILGNALDNALEACQRLRLNEPEADVFIRLYSVQKGGVLILSIENSFDGKLKLNGDDELPITDKSDKSAHGMGLFNIKRTAEKYGGTMDFKVVDRTFVLSVMLKTKGGIVDSI